MSRRPTHLLPWLMLLGCSPTTPGDGVVCGRTGLIYGTDTRTEPLYYADPTLRDLVLASSVALMRADRVRIEPDGSVRFNARTHGETQQLCPGEAFATQVAAGFCSGTLIDDDLVLTAAHCLKNEASCQSTRFVFGYAIDAAGGVGQVREEHVFGCRRLVISQYDETEVAGIRLDFAIAQLDRPATPRQVPMPTAPELLLNPGDPVLLFGYPDGIPLKIDPYGAVMETRPRRDYFLASVDAFKGNSGSGVVGPDGRLVGILVRGATDYYEDTHCGGCRRPQINVSGVKAGEGVNYVGPALAALCAMGWPSPRICKIEPYCPDGVCSPSEVGVCTGDCMSSMCGNGRCEPGELGRCPDCDIPTDSAPDTWTCGSGYAIGDGCDCDCGVYDPDCNMPYEDAYNCDPGVRCTNDGTCEGSGAVDPDSMVPAPEGWTCSAAFKYAGSDGCDCECGLPDPDCETAPTPVFRCENTTSFTCVAGRCVPASGSVAPAGWTCGDATYMDGATCNCGCGEPDPDCTGSAPVAGCAAGQSCDATGACRDMSMVPPTGTLLQSFSGSFTTMGDMMTHTLTTTSFASSLRFVLTPMGGDVDLFVGGSDVSNTTNECRSSRSNLEVDECSLASVAPRTVYALARAYSTMPTSYRIDVYMEQATPVAR